MKIPQLSRYERWLRWQKMTVEQRIEYHKTKRRRWLRRATRDLASAARSLAARPKNRLAWKRLKLAASTFGSAESYVIPYCSKN